MQIVLLEDVKTLGKKGSVVNVNDGYARNFIIPKKLGVEATPANLAKLKQQKAYEAKLEAQQLADAQALAEQIAGKEVVLAVRVGEGGKVFGSVSGKEIEAAARTQCGLELDKKKFQLPEPIKKVGVYQVPVRLHREVLAELKVVVKEA